MAAVDQDHILAAARDLPRDDQHILFIRNRLLREESVHCRLPGERKYRFDPQPVTACTDELRAHPLPQDCPQGINEDGLAGAGLTGEYI